MPDESPNVLVLQSDQHSYRCFGHLDTDGEGEPVQTPFFDRLAANSAVFDQTYCPVPICTPSRVATLTGRYARRAGAWNNAGMIRPDLLTIPEHFTQHGYETCTVGKMHVGGDRQFCGFQHRPYGDLTGGAGHQPDGRTLDEGKGKTRTTRVTTTGRTWLPESMLQETNVAEETVSFLREHQSNRPEQPWVMWASFSRPHHPVTAPDRHIQRYDADEIPPPKVGRDTDTDDHPFMQRYREIYELDTLEDDEIMESRAAYFACVSYVDEVIGDLFLRLEQSGLLDNTIVVYTSDHGDLNGEHGIPINKQGWQEGSARVPLFVQLPEHRTGQYSASRVSTPVSLVDLFPTLCGLANVELPDGVDGVDLSAAVQSGEAPPERPIFIDFLTNKLGSGNEYRAVRDGRYKYVQFNDAPELLFDLENDPLERENVATSTEPKHRAAFERLRELVMESIDFAEVERQRAKDEALKADHSLGLDWTPVGGSGNMYHLPDDRIVVADSPVYNPDIVTDDPAGEYPDWPN